VLGLSPGCAVAVARRPNARPKPREIASAGIRWGYSRIRYTVGFCGCLARARAAATPIEAFWEAIASASLFAELLDAGQAIEVTWS
jgi:hypothetical protein